MKERALKARAARMLELAELNLRRAQAAHDGSESARHSYARARRLLAEAEALGTALMEPDRIESVFEAHDRELERARAGLAGEESTAAQRRFALAVFRRERLYGQFPLLASGRRPQPSHDSSSELVMTPSWRVEP